MFILGRGSDTNEYGIYTVGRNIGFRNITLYTINSQMQPYINNNNISPHAMLAMGTKNKEPNMYLVIKGGFRLILFFSQNI